MAIVTMKGRELAGKLMPSMDITPAILKTCSLICKAATSYKRIQEAKCNGHPACSDPRLPIETVTRLQAEHEAWCDRREAQLERVLQRHVDSLPLVDGLAVGLVFQGDPRGATVKLRMPDGRYDDWAREGICVPGS